MLNRLFCWLAFLAPGGDSLRPALHRWRGMKIGRRVWISQLVYLDVLYPRGITIGDDVTLAFRTTIFTHFHRGAQRGKVGCKEVILEDGVFVGPHSIILPGVRIGQGSVIKAGSVVTRNVPPHTFWGDRGGGPLAEVTVPLTPEHEFEEFIRGLRPFRGHQEPSKPKAAGEKPENQG